MRSRDLIDYGSRRDFSYEQILAYGVSAGLWRLLDAFERRKWLTAVLKLRDELDGRVRGSGARLCSQFSDRQDSKEIQTFRRRIPDLGTFSKIPLAPEVASGRRSV